MNWKKWIKNKYVIVTVSFLVWMTFFNDIDLIYILKSRAQLNQMNDQIEYLKAENEKAKEDLHDLTTNLNTLEKYAREEYYMKKDNEDVFVIRSKK